MKRLLAIILIVPLLLAGCAADDPWTDDVYLSTLYVWDGSTWNKITENGGTSAFAITWLGTFADAPVGPALNDAYRNSTDGIVYLWDGAAWQEMVEDGLPGPQGVQGPVGPAGAKGDKGDQGDPGSQGIQGEVGPAGAQGPQGLQGVAGADGADGISVTWLGTYASAPESPSLNDGYYNSTDKKSYIWDGDSWEIITQDGATGAQGPQGEQGPAGAQGEVGPQGPAGVDGVDGEDGAQGPQGEQGPAGPQGEQGPQGLQGIQGETGATGATGPEGPQGPQGIQGEQGIQGPAGEQGPQGIQGPAGEDGAPGLPGEDGVDGISIEWLGSLAEAPGSPTLNQAYYDTVDKKSYVYDGDSWEILTQDGATGETGPAGADGEDGAPGPNEVTTSTATTGTGYLYGDGSFISFVAGSGGADNHLTSALSSNNTWSGLTSDFTAGENLTAYNVCYLNAGEMSKASASAFTTLPAVAMATAAIDADDSDAFILYGFVRNDSWDWTPNTMIFVDTTAGGMTQTAPNSTGNQIQVVGVAITADIMLFNPQVMVLELG